MTEHPVAIIGTSPASLFLASTTAGTPFPVKSTAKLMPIMPLPMIATGCFQSLDVDYIVPGHGPVKGKECIAENKQFIYNWLSVVGDAIINKGWTREECIQRINFADANEHHPLLRAVDAGLLGGVAGGVVALEGVAGQITPNVYTFTGMRGCDPSMVLTSEGASVSTMGMARPYLPHSSWFNPKKFIMEW